MYLLGHVGSALGLHFIYERIQNEKNSRRMILLGIGSMIPDFIDKPIGALLFSRGRWLGHSLIGLTSIFLILMMIDYFQQNKKFDFDKYGLYLYIGSLIHLLGDQPSLDFQVVFWPLLGQFPTTEPETFLLGLNNMFIKITEAIGLIIIVGIGFYEKWDREQWLILLGIVISYIVLFFLLFFLLVGNPFVYFI